MFFKDKRRAERRWRSFHKWMRRLRSDWNDHGWKRDPVYRREMVDGKLVTCEAIGTTLCDCFNLRHMQALRFKDTPTGGHSKRRCGCSEPPLEYKEERKLEARDDWHKRKRREGERRVRRFCGRCGVLLGWYTARFGEGVSWTVRSGNCESCERTLAEKSVYWLNGRRQEFDKKPA
jgi:hypothetical protein